MAGAGKGDAPRPILNFKQYESTKLRLWPKPRKGLGAAKRAVSNGKGKTTYHY